MHIQIFEQHKLLAEFDCDLDAQQISNYKCYTDVLLDKPFGDDMSPDYPRVMAYLEDRCWPRNRFNIDEILESLGLAEYDPIDIVHKTHGLKHCDYIWLKFDTDPEDLTYDKIKIRD